MITGHGGNVQALAQRNGCTVDEIIDMSSNINPLGPPEGVEAFIIDNIHKIRSLPQADALDMVNAFSDYYQVDAKRVIGGNGTTWFIYTLPRALSWKKVLIAGPTYADYRDGCIMHDADYSFCMSLSENRFHQDLSKIGSMAGDVDAVIICNPNNPTGALIPVEEIISLVKEHPDTWFVLDESYLPFVENAEKISLVAETRFPNLIVLSSMSKIFRIPGLRTGYLCADPAVIEKLMKFYQPWSVNALSQAAIVHILENPEHIAPFMETTRQFVIKEREIFEQAMAGIDGVKLYKSDTYFMLAELLGTMNSAGVCNLVGNERILIRDCANFHGLSDRFVRFSLRDRETNLHLARIMKGVL
ncbi:L-threonine O-3-phosphate decarboxylase [Desulfocicer vacuolatum DSM 3385]|uniref:L-threonine O-3-phosphate decarboxylase n=1 Tax=Desulfocicer vacuolatum DSM 3385 TaxID=1121400 RepID=A0A1W2CKT3_9BACT|nr:threonine-phosphate decarboxylase [Desulfocicer vacuolatum]SMC85512.1 L-threonine O-3-phosphate decarboxylase [Desulfocicer vacuolatum DSM 3385]